MDHGGVKISRPLEHTGGHAGDYTSHTRDFLRQNDTHGKPLTTSTANALQKMFNVNKNDVHIRADGQGKITMQLKDAHGDPIGRTQVYDVKQLRSEIAKDFEYQVKRHIISEHMNIPVEDLNNLNEINGIYHSKDRNGDHYVINSDNTGREAIDKDISSLGLDNNKQHIPDSIENAALKHAIDQEIDPAKKAALKYGMVYDYEKEGKLNVYYILTKQKSTDETEVRDGKMERVSFTANEHKNLLDDARLNAVRKFGELPDGTKLTDDMEVDFAPDDKTKFVVRDTNRGEHTLTGDSDLSDGRTLKDAIDSELNVKPSDKNEILTKKSSDILIDTKGTDSKVEVLEDKLEKYKKWTTQILRFLKFLEGTNNIFLQESQNVEQLAAELLHTQDTPSQQQPIGSAMTESTRRMVKKKVKDNIEIMKKEIEIELKNSGTGKRTAAGKAIEEMAKLRHTIEKNKDLPREDRAELLLNIDHDDSTSDTSDTSSAY